MVKQNVAYAVEQLAQPVIEAAGLELVDVEFVKEGGYWYLRIYIDKPGGVDLDDCQSVSRVIEQLLDETDPIQHAYSLEVSSPGLERPLRKAADYQRYEGRLATVTTYAPVGGRKKFTGHLKGLRDGKVVLAEEKQETAIPLDQIATARLTVEF